VKACGRIATIRITEAQEGSTVSQSWLPLSEWCWDAFYDGPYSLKFDLQGAYDKYVVFGYPFKEPMPGGVNYDFALAPLQRAGQLRRATPVAL
jgi:hypothetical protein